MALTVKGRTVEATANHSKRTFTLRTSTGSKYRTLPMSKEEFNSCCYSTSADWNNFLSYSDAYYTVK